MSTDKKLTVIDLIEDDCELAKMIQSFLVNEGFVVNWIDNGIDAEKAILNDKPDLIILDIMLPGVDGIEVCRRIKKTFQNPILMFTAKGDDLTEILALNTGADCFLNKPVRPHVLLAHINSLLRRNIVEVFQDGRELIKVQDLTIDYSGYRLYKGDKEIILTGGEYQLFALLAKNQGHTVDRDTLSKQLKGVEYDGLNRSIDLMISSIRKKLNDSIPPYCYIKTIRSKGYILLTG